MLSANFKPKTTAAPSRGFLATSTSQGITQLFSFFKVRKLERGEIIGIIWVLE